jgi:hypothetical protein
MRRINPTINGKRYEQVSKPTARKLFKQGRTIYLNACKMMPGNVWQSLCPVTIDRDRIEATPEEQFKHIVNNFEFYNCDSERGRYANYFIKID